MPIIDYGSRAGHDSTPNTPGDPPVFYVDPAAVDLVDLLEHLAERDDAPEVREAAGVILGALTRRGADLWLDAIRAAER
ncbi:hypothetical protein [Geodermatophilus sp. TF02-6]|uniref:hypothetical protein n=1 Tax=Geodermatophilus sp. TF02-6 TaxID=2250575 RepID=UPI0013140C4A|nr:hypothetical protein [Geodermatophilus sp. TF02-6]